MPLEAVMTALPQVVTPKESLAHARSLMDEHGIHHLPVVENGRLRGMVREHDLAFLETRPGVDPEKVSVADAMTANVYAVAPDCPLGEVFGTMADHRYDAVVVVEGGDVIGIVTTVDAMRVLAGLLGASTGDLAPSQVRERIQADHQRLLGLLDQIDAVARRVLDGDEDAEPRLRQWAKDLYGFLQAHLYLENEILVPALATRQALATSAPRPCVRSTVSRGRSSRGSSAGWHAQPWPNPWPRSSRNCPAPCATTSPARSANSWEPTCSETT